MTPTTNDVAALTAQFVAQLAAVINQQQKPEDTTTLQPRLLTAAQAADYLGRSESAVRHLIHQRDLPVIRDGRCVRIDRKDLDIWIQNHRC